MIRVSYLVIGLVLAVLLVAVGGVGFVIGRSSPATDENATDSSTIEADTGSMMGSRGGNGMGSMMNGGSMMGSLDEEGKPFDLQFIDKMIPHHGLTKSERPGSKRSSWSQRFVPVTGL